MNKRLKFIHTFSVYLEVVTMLDIDINVQVLTQNLHNFVNSNFFARPEGCCALEGKKLQIPGAAQGCFSQRLACWVKIF